jgi:hypothetical protein
MECDSFWPFSFYSPWSAITFLPEQMNPAPPIEPLG